MKHTFYTPIILIATFSVFQSANAIVTKSCNDSQLDAYSLYECRIESICNQRKPDKMIFNTDKDEKKYLKLEPWYNNFLWENKQKYRDNMNNLYKCALIQLQTNAITYVEWEMKNSDEDVRKKIEPKISQKKQNLKTAASRYECADIDNLSIYNKSSVLQQSSYEICKYLNYLDYLDTYSDTLSNVVTNSVTATELANNQIQTKQAIIDEQNHVIRVFPLAYTAYAQYESHITTHFMLELIREDFLILKNRLHKVLGPISQLLYKANNSMKKP